MKKYKIIKLRSGEDLVGSVRVGRDGNIKIHRPMLFKSMVQHDIFGGMKELFMLKNWLILSEEKVASIPKEAINTIVNASKEVCSLYEIELLKENEKPLSPKKASMDDLLPPLDPNEDPLDMLSKHVQEMMEKADKRYEQESNSKEFAKPKPDDKMIFMNMVFSPDVIIQLLRSGILDRKELGEMVDQITNENGEGMNPQKYTGKRKDKKDLGNKWTDWNADPSSDDYK